MLITVDNKDYMDYKFFDCTNRRLNYVREFDTETCEVVVVLPIAADGIEGITRHRVAMVVKEDGDFEMAIARVVLKGAYALGKDGKRI